MPVQLPTKTEEAKVEEQKPADNLPPVETSEPEKETVEEKAHRLELELAEAKGKLSVSQPSPRAETPLTLNAQEVQWQNTKNQVFGDASALSDEDFSERYKMSKADAKLQIYQYDNQIKDQKMAERTARMEAENTLLAKYGKEYGEVSDKVREAIQDASPEVRQDPEKLSRYLERSFKSIQVETLKPKPVFRREETPIRRIVNDFERPSVSNSSEEKSKNKDKNDALEPEFAPLAAQFGITSKSERDQYRIDKNPYIEMDFGSGVTFGQDGLKKKIA